MVEPRNEEVWEELGAAVEPRNEAVWEELGAAVEPRNEAVWEALTGAMFHPLAALNPPCPALPGQS